jgi:lipoprotein NlpD
LNLAPAEPRQRLIGLRRAGDVALRGRQRKGVDIEGRIGEPVLAAVGKVTYAGSGMRLGNLLIIQHANSLSSVCPQQQAAGEGQTVTAGQKIAELGNSDADQAKLHFEIRRQGKPLDPLKLLPPR